jgi:hypothetical protein
MFFSNDLPSGGDVNQSSRFRGPFDVTSKGESVRMSNETVHSARRMM